MLSGALDRQSPPNHRRVFLSKRGVALARKAIVRLDDPGTPFHALVPPPPHPAEVASLLGSEQDLPRRRPRPRPAQALHPRHVPLPQRRRPPRRPPRGLH